MAPSRASAVREGGGEASVGVRVGWDIEPRNPVFRGADAVSAGGRQHRSQRYSRAVGGPRAVEDPVHARESPDARTGRPDDCPSCRPAKWVLCPLTASWVGREGKAKAVIPRCTVTGSQTAPYYLRSCRTTPGDRLRRWWREGGCPRGARPAKRIPDPEPERVCPVTWIVYAEQHRRTGTHGSPRSCITSTVERLQDGVPGFEPGCRRWGGRGDVAVIRAAVWRRISTTCTHDCTGAHTGRSRLVGL